jgi:hypothetical protein
MIELLLYINLTCTEAVDIIETSRKVESLPKTVILEIEQEIKKSTPQCEWDANG